MYSPADTATATPAKFGEAQTTRVAVIGLGYVGLPLAVALAGRFETIGLDIDTRRIIPLYW
jgi:UDP-N-acetyl-D-galactosamine dehydrogenase